MWFHASRQLKDHHVDCHCTKLDGAATAAFTIPRQVNLSSHQFTGILLRRGRVKLVSAWTDLYWRQDRRKVRQGLMDEVWGHGVCGRSRRKSDLAAEREFACSLPEQGATSSLSWNWIIINGMVSTPAQKDTRRESYSAMSSRPLLALRLGGSRSTEEAQKKMNG